MRRFIVLFFLCLLSVPCPSSGTDLYEEQMNRGIRNSDPYSYLLIRESRVDSANAISILQKALKHSPDLPAVYFELAKRKFDFTHQGIFQSVDYMLQGIAAYQRNFWWSYMLLSSLVMSIILSFLVSVLILILIRLFRDLPLLSHDIKEGRSKILVLLILVFTIFGPLYLLGALLFIVSLYQKKWNRLVFYLYILFMLSSPWMSEAFSLIFDAPASGELKAVVRVNEGRENTYALSLLKNSDNPVELFSYALALKREGRYREAIDIYRKLLTVRPDPRIYNNLANCYVAVHDLETAKELYLKSVERSPLPSALYNLSQVYRETFQFEKGEEYFLSAQRLDSNAVSQFRSIFSRNPNRFVIDEPLSVSDIWEYSRAKASGAFPTGLSTLPPAVIPAIGIVMAFFFYTLTRRLKHWAYRCSRCGKILCPKCERHILWGHMCLQCYRSLVKLDELDAKERISRLLTVYEYQKKRRNFIKAISFLVPGSGHIYAGNVLYGFLFLWLFLFFLFVPVMNSFFVIQMSGFSHLWLNICSVFLMIMVYFLYNAITRRRLAKGWL